MRFSDEIASGSGGSAMKARVTAAEEPSSRPRRALLLVNAKSRSGNAACDAAEAALAQSGLVVDRRECGKAEDLRQSILRARHDVDSVIIGGGDGTLNAALPAILETDLPLGILPLGTANDLARTLNLPTTLEDAIAVIAVSGHCGAGSMSGLVNDKHRSSMSPASASASISPGR